ncbi:MAG: hypothetical protein ABWK01_03825 [Infirmifilum sp.]
MLLDRLPSRLVAHAVRASKAELGRRLPIHMVHRWWSRRFAAVYRLLLAAYLLSSEEKVVEAIEKPEVLRPLARGKVFLEPFAGGGTGLVEATLAGFDVVGYDVNPVAALAAQASAGIASRGLPPGYEDKCTSLLNAALDRVTDLWSYRGAMVTHIFVTRGRIATWLSTTRGRYVAICPSCYSAFETAHPRAKCPHCGFEFEVSAQPNVNPPAGLPREADGWAAYAVELREVKRGHVVRKYLSVSSDRELARWLEETAAKAEEMLSGYEGALHGSFSVDETFRLRMAGITEGRKLFSPRQLASLKVYSELAREHSQSRWEVVLHATAVSESAKTCTLLAKWYPPLGEVVPAGGVKAQWVPLYTATVNPLAHVPGTLRPLGRGTIASALRAQLRAIRYVAQRGGPSGAALRIKVGDAVESKFSPRVDLSVLDPPYGRVRSYASLSLPHYYALRLFDAVTHERLSGGYTPEEAERREITPRRSLEKLEIIVAKLRESLSSRSRVVLMYNSVNEDEWVKVLQPFARHGLSATAVYWVLGEAPSGITASLIKGMHLIVFKRGRTQGEVNTAFREPLDAAREITKLHQDIEAKAHLALLSALSKIYKPLDR